MKPRILLSILVVTLALAPSLLAQQGSVTVIQNGNKQGWFWYIPLHGNIVSVGVVAPFDYLFKGRTNYAQTYEEEVDRFSLAREFSQLLQEGPDGADG